MAFAPSSSSPLVALRQALEFSLKPVLLFERFFLFDDGINKSYGNSVELVAVLGAEAPAARSFHPATIPCGPAAIQRNVCNAERHKQISGRHHSKNVPAVRAAMRKEKRRCGNLVFDLRNDDPNGCCEIGRLESAWLLRSNRQLVLSRFEIQLRAAECNPSRWPLSAIGHRKTEKLGAMLVTRGNIVGHEARHAVLDNLFRARGRSREIVVECHRDGMQSVRWRRRRRCGCRRRRLILLRARSLLRTCRRSCDSLHKSPEGSQKQYAGQHAGSVDRMSHSVILPPPRRTRGIQLSPEYLNQHARTAGDRRNLCANKISAHAGDGTRFACGRRRSIDG
jgi:hypothetical protein